jgi:hypothetical protein
MEKSSSKTKPKNKSLKERLRERRKALAKGEGNSAFFFPKEGTTRYRILPVDSEQDFAIELVHFYLGPEIKGVISPATFGEPCAIMDAYNKLKNSKHEDDREKARDLKPKKKIALPAIRYIDERGKQVDKEAGVRLLLIGTKVYAELLDLYLDDEAGDFTDPVSGYDIKIKRSGSGMTDTEYKVIPCKPTPLAKEYAKQHYDPEAMLREVMTSYEETVDKIEEFLGGSLEDTKVTKKKKKKKVS